MQNASHKATATLRQFHVRKDATTIGNSMWMSASNGEFNITIGDDKHPTAFRLVLNELQVVQLATAIGDYLADPTKHESYMLEDARGIPCGVVCDRCVHDTMAKFRPEIFTQSSYHTDEPIDEE